MRNLRRQKLLARANVFSGDFGSAILRGEAKQLVSALPEPEFVAEPPKSFSTALPDPPKKVEASKPRIPKKKIRKIKTILFTFLAFLTAFVVQVSSFESKSNLFVLFLLTDVAISLAFFREPSKVDADLFSPSLRGFISVVEKLGWLFEVFDDLAAFFVPFVCFAGILKFFTA